MTHFSTVETLTLMRDHRSVWLRPGLAGSNPVLMSGKEALGKVYRASFRKMLKDELIELVSAYWNRRPREKRYRITKAGRKWLKSA